MDWMKDMLYQQQINQEQQNFVNQQLLEYGEKAAKTKKRDVINYLQSISCASTVEQVEEFETPNTRHICMGSKEIKVLPKNLLDVQTSEGTIRVEYFLCPSCKLLLVNKGSLWML